MNENELHDYHLNKSEVFESASDSSVNEIEEENNQVNDRFKKVEGYHAVPPPYTGNYMPSRPDLSFVGLDDSIYKTNVSETISSVPRIESTTSKSSKNSLEQPKYVRPSAPIIEEWEFDSDDDCVIRPSFEQNKPTHSSVKRAFNQKSAAKTNKFNEKVNTARVNNVTTAGPKAVISAAVRNGENAVKSLACWIWRPIGNIIDHNSKDSGSYMLKRFEYVNLQGRLKSVMAWIINRLMVDLLHLKEVLKENRVLITKPHSKTPYELLVGRSPNLDFMRPFGCPVTILNTLDHLGKFEGKADEGFLVGYSVNSKAFRVFNSRTRKVEENLHIKFLENKSNVAGSGPEWLFDIDSLTKSMNYEPVTAGNQTNDDAGIETNINAGQAGQEKASDHEYILLPFMPSDSPLSSSNQNSEDKDADDEPGKGDEGLDQERTDSSTQDINTAGPIR
ncbi:retrovirus-related pol polyprotein from transposon TNT 1-94 [Tanacetum coccineum]